MHLVDVGEGDVWPRGPQARRDIRLRTVGGDQQVKATIASPRSASAGTDSLSAESGVLLHPLVDLEIAGSNTTDANSDIGHSG